MARAAERDEDKIRAGIKQAEYVKKGTSAILCFHDVSFEVLTSTCVEIEAL